MAKICSPRRLFRQRTMQFKDVFGADILNISDAQIRLVRATKLRSKSVSNDNQFAAMINPSKANSARIAFSDDDSGFLSYLSGQ